MRKIGNLTQLIIATEARALGATEKARVTAYTNSGKTAFISLPRLIPDRIETLTTKLLKSKDNIVPIPDDLDTKSYGPKVHFMTAC